jgi:inositol oxygenase
MADPGTQRDTGFRDFSGHAPDRVRELYRENHARQTLELVLAKKAEYLPLRHRRMGIWDAFEALDRFVDASDPDLDLPQTAHALQTAESLRRAGAPEWQVLVGLVHDLGKVLHLFGEPQWAIVGDTFPVGCAFSERIVFPELFAANPDSRHPEYATALGIYPEHCGLDQVHFSWGHDEYLFRVLEGVLDETALYLIRYHSFYAGHREGAYARLLCSRDRRLLPRVREFSAHDLYSKGEAPPDAGALRSRYEDLAAKFLPAELWW